MLPTPRGCHQPAAAGEPGRRRGAGVASAGRRRIREGLLSVALERYTACSPCPCSGGAFAGAKGEPWPEPVPSLRFSLCAPRGAACVRPVSRSRLAQKWRAGEILGTRARLLGIHASSFPRWLSPFSLRRLRRHAWADRGASPDPLSWITLTAVVTLSSLAGAVPRLPLDSACGRRRPRACSCSRDRAGCALAFGLVALGAQVTLSIAGGRAAPG